MLGGGGGGWLLKLGALGKGGHPMLKSGTQEEKKTDSPHFSTSGESSGFFSDSTPLPAELLREGQCSAACCPAPATVPVQIEEGVVKVRQPQYCCYQSAP